VLARQIQPTALRQRAVAIGGSDCDDASGAVCGTLTVPLDWSGVQSGTLGIAWKLYVHTAPGAAVSAVTLNFGGPGERTISPGDDLAHFLLGPLFETHDVLLFDDRGRGQSGALDCPALQHETGPLQARVAACVAQLGPALGLYSSSSIARDLEALRQALGIGSLDYVGNSYGTMDALAYAARYPKRTRSIVVAAGYGPEQFAFGTSLASSLAGIRRNVSVLCARSVPCHAAIADPLGELRWGARFLRNHPLDGDSTTPEGKPVHVRLTEARLAFIAGIGDSFGALNAGELPAALRALRGGDPAPILRIAAPTSDVSEFLWSDSGEVTEWSVASFLATECVDNRTPPWGRGLTYEQRMAEALARMRHLPGRTLSPWSPDSLMELPGLVFDDQMLACRYWPDAPGESVVPGRRALPDVPVLGITSQLDQFGDAVKAELRRFPRSQLVDVGVTPHPATFWRCGPARLQQFLDTLGPVAPTCQGEPEPAWHAQSSFPRTSSDAKPLAVEPGGDDRSTKADRRVAAVAVEAVLDTWWQLQRQCCGPSSGKGLRGGDWSWEFAPGDAGFAISLDKVRFAEDTTVSGSLAIPFGAGAAAKSDVTVEGPGGISGTLQISGVIPFSDPAGTGLVVTGRLGGRTVALHAAVG